MGGYGSGPYGWGPYGESGAAGSPANPPTASVPPISYRQVIDGEPQWGQGTGNFLVGIEAVAQLIQTRLLLFLGEWFLNVQDGLPLFQLILGQTVDENTFNALIQARINGTPYVISSSGVSGEFDPSTGQFGYSAQVQTVFGPMTITNPPQNQSVI